MKKLFVLTLTALLFSCSKNEEILQIESHTEAEAALFLNATGDANKQYAKMGPYKVATSAVRGDCLQLLGIVQKVLGKVSIVNPAVRCSPSFPYGFEDRFTTEVHYPSNIASLGKLPVVNFVGGLVSNPGNYDATIKLWASHGFIVVNTSNFINFSPSVHIYGLNELAKLNKDPKSPLYNKVDLSRILLSGHSAGGSGAIEVSKRSEKDLRIIDPDLRIIGSFPLEASFAANANGVRVPTLILTGHNDALVPAHSFPLVNQFAKISVPAWYACATTASHLSPVRAVNKNEFVGISVAFMLYIAKNDAAAARYFVGPNYGLANDKQFVQDRSLLQIAAKLRVPLGRNIAVQRNKQATKL